MCKAVLFFNMPFFVFLSFVSLFFESKQRLLSAQVPTATWMHEGIRDVFDQLKASKSCLRCRVEHDRFLMP